MSGASFLPSFLSLVVANAISFFENVAKVRELLLEQLDFSGAALAALFRLRPRHAYRPAEALRRGWHIERQTAAQSRRPAYSHRAVEGLVATA